MIFTFPAYEADDEDDNSDDENGEDNGKTQAIK